MTNREFFNAVVNANISEEITAHATEQIEKLDTRNAKRSSKPSKAQLENEGIKDRILTTLENKAMFAAEIATELDISTNKAAALCKQLADSGKIKVTEVKVPKRGKCKQYSVVGENLGEFEVEDTLSE